MSLDETFPHALPEGTILAGQYVIEKTLGQGGFGITYKATDHKTGQSVAVKEFFPDSMATRTTATTVSAFSGARGESFAYGKGCFLQEAETLAEFIGNENIVRVYSYFEENGTAYFVMEFIEGTSFDQYIKDQGGKVPYEEAEKILLPVIDALALVHSKGIVHRDVTPDNIYITKDGRVKLLDFGAARYSLGDKSRSLDVVLKHGFAPKEQYTRHGRQGPYTDVYTVGASFYFAITGRRPPDSIDRMDEDELIAPSSLGVKIAPEKEDAILKAMSVQPSGRYQTMADFHQALMIADESETQSDMSQTVQEEMPEATTPQPAVQQRIFTAPESIPSSTTTQQQQVPQPETVQLDSQNEQDDAVARLKQLHEEANAAVDANAEMLEKKEKLFVALTEVLEKKRKLFVAFAAIVVVIVSIIYINTRDVNTEDISIEDMSIEDINIRYRYILHEDYIEITEYLYNDSALKIPSKIEGKPVKRIGDDAFSHCDSLTSIEIPDSVTEIGKRAFYYCDNLTSINIPDSVTEIEYSAFGNCDSLTSIEIPDSITRIGKFVFGSCDSLTSVTISEHTTVHADAFKNCPNVIITSR